MYSQIINIKSRTNKPCQCFASLFRGKSSHLIRAYSEDAFMNAQASLHFWHIYCNNRSNMWMPETKLICAVSRSLRVNFIPNIKINTIKQHMPLINSPFNTKLRHLKLHPVYRCSVWLQLHQRHVSPFCCASCM